MIISLYVYFVMCCCLILFQAIFSVTFPNPDVFLVAHIDKILQSSISQCADNYTKAADSTKVLLVHVITEVHFVYNEGQVSATWIVNLLVDKLVKEVKKLIESHVVSQE